MGLTSTTAIAAVALMLGLIFRKRKIGGDWIVWLFFIAGLGLAGIFGDLLTRIGGVITNAGTTGSATLTGAAVPTIAAIGLTALMVIDMIPKYNTSKIAPWIALVVPSVWATTGGAWADLGTTGDSLVATSGTSLSTFFEQLVVGL